MIKIVIFEDNILRRSGLKMLLDSMDHMSCVGDFDDCTDIVNHIKKLKPDVILMDINMPNVDGIEGLKLVKNHFPEIKVVMLTVFEEEYKILEAICAKADGYLLKQNSPMKLLDGIQEVMDGGAPMTPSVAKKVLSLFNNSIKKIKGDKIEFTKREKEILKLLVQGYSYKMIASKCFISYATVNKHISNIYAKMQVHSVAAAVSRAIKEGLV
ncbi:MAG: response regulator transcription factor [Saprospiraceae bacterium]|nr:response regulator transcription factor [Saprospiraceae bacterium]